MKSIYWTYRPERITEPETLPNWDTRNWAYLPWMYINNQFWDWNKAGLTNLKDSEIPDEHYIWEIVPWVRKLTRFLVFDYNETYVDPIELARSAKNIGWKFDITMFDTPEITISRIKANTNLVEEAPWVFLISEEGEFMGQVVPRKTLVIN